MTTYYLEIKTTGKNTCNYYFKTTSYINIPEIYKYHSNRIWKVYNSGCIQWIKNIPNGTMSPIDYKEFLLIQPKAEKL